MTTLVRAINYAHLPLAGEALQRDVLFMLNYLNVQDRFFGDLARYAEIWKESYDCCVAGNTGLWSCLPEIDRHLRYFVERRDEL